MTPSAERVVPTVLTDWRPTLRRAAPFLAARGSSLLVRRGLRRAGSPPPSGSGPARPRHARARPSQPAQPGADPLSLLAWLFTPIFQGMFILLVGALQFLTNAASRPPSAGRSSC